LTYKCEAVNDEPLLDILVRSDNPRDANNTNKKLYIFFLHREALYFWEKGRKEVAIV